MGSPAVQSTELTQPNQIADLIGGDKTITIARETAMPSSKQ